MKQKQTRPATTGSMSTMEKQQSKTTIEQVFLSRQSKQDSMLLRRSSGLQSLKSADDESFQFDESERREKVVRRIHDRGHPSKDFYYSHINEIRSIKEFMYMVEKVKRKNIERKMMEKIQLRNKLRKIKEIEVWKKMSYYLEKRIRHFLKVNEHSENPNAKNFENFAEIVSQDPRLKQFTLDKIKSEFVRCKQSVSVNHIEKEKSETELKKRLNKSADVQATQVQPAEGTSKMLTMKVADKLLTLMLVEQTREKRVPINGKTDVKEDFSKPFGGKMNFTPNSFTWLVENTLERSKFILRKQSATFSVRRLPDQRGVAREHLFQVSDVPHNPMALMKELSERSLKIDKVMAARTKRIHTAQPVRGLKNRRVVVQQYDVMDRIKENVQLQRKRNQMSQKLTIGTHKVDPQQMKNDKYVGLYM